MHRQKCVRDSEKIIHRVFSQVGFACHFLTGRYSLLCDFAQHLSKLVHEHVEELLQIPLSEGSDGADVHEDLAGLETVDGVRDDIVA